MNTKEISRNIFQQFQTNLRDTSKIKKNPLSKEKKKIQTKQKTLINEPIPLSNRFSPKDIEDPVETTTHIKIIIMSCRQHGYPWPSLATSPYHSSPPAGLLGYIPCLHIAAVCKFGLVVLLLLGHMWGSIGVRHLQARPCFSSRDLIKNINTKDKPTENKTTNPTKKKMKHKLQKVDIDQLQDQRKNKKIKNQLLPHLLKQKTNLKLKWTKHPQSKSQGNLNRAQVPIGQAGRVLMNREVISERPRELFKLPPAKFNTVTSPSRTKSPK